MSIRLDADIQPPFIVEQLRPRLIACLLSFVAVGCSDTPIERNYTKLVEVDGQTALKIECEYVGKKPGDPGRYVSDHDYQSIDTDFYRITIENVTDMDFVMERVEYRLVSGPMKGRQSASAGSIKRTWGTNVVPANSQISRANNMVWSKSKRDSLFKTYYFNVEGQHELIPAEIRLVYQR